MPLSWPSPADTPPILEHAFASSGNGSGKLPERTVSGCDSTGRGDGAHHHLFSKPLVHESNVRSVTL